MNTVRVKFGPNPYAQAFVCAVCRSGFDQGGLFLRLEADGNVVDVPVCALCWSKGNLLEGVIDMTRHNPSHPVGLA